MIAVVQIVQSVEDMSRRCGAPGGRDRVEDLEVAGRD